MINKEELLALVEGLELQIEFLEWVHPMLGVTKVELEGGKPLVLRVKIKEKKND